MTGGFSVVGQEGEGLKKGERLVAWFTLVLRYPGR